MVKRSRILGWGMRRSSSASAHSNTGGTTISTGRTTSCARPQGYHCVTTVASRLSRLQLKKRSRSVSPRRKPSKRSGHCQVSVVVPPAAEPSLTSVEDTYTEDELIRGSSWFLQSSRRTKLQVHTGLRDRCMLLISTSSAFRGNNIRSLLLSDLALRDVPMPDLGLENKVTVNFIYIYLSHEPPQRD